MAAQFAKGNATAPLEGIMGAVAAAVLARPPLAPAADPRRTCACTSLQWLRDSMQELAPSAAQLAQDPIFDGMVRAAARDLANEGAQLRPGVANHFSGAAPLTGWHAASGAARQAAPHFCSRGAAAVPEYLELLQRALRDAEAAAQGQVPGAGAAGSGEQAAAAASGGAARDAPAGAAREHAGPAAAAASGAHAADGARSSSSAAAPGVSTAAAPASAAVTSPECPVPEEPSQDAAAADMAIQPAPASTSDATAHTSEPPSEQLADGMLQLKVKGEPQEAASSAKGSSDAAAWWLPDVL